MLEIKNITKTFNPSTPNEVRALQGVDLTIDEGSFVIVIGTNGSGKSTLLKTIVGLHPAQCGTAVVLGSEPGALDRLFDKLRRNGGDVKYVTRDEPFYYGHRDSSPTSCHESAQALTFPAKSDESWTRNAVSKFARVEKGVGITP